MVWNTQNAAFMASPNYAALAAPNYAAYAAPNYAAYGAPNYAAYAAPNYAAYASPNYAAYSAPNYAAYGAPNYAAIHLGPTTAAQVSPAPVVAPVTGTGAGGASGTGFLGGYGPVARFEYATPAALAPLPWSMDFAAGDGWPSFPLEQRLDAIASKLEWRPGDWDPALRFWTLPFDTQLTEWLQDLNLAAPAVAAAREFAAHHNKWKAPGSAIHKQFEHQQIEQKTDATGEVIGTKREFFQWQNGRGDAIRREIEELVDLMRDDRLRYLEEVAAQSGQATPYFVHLMGFDPTAKPWTMELMNCASAIGNLVKMHYKAHYKRVRPSTLCPALVPPWGPPRHPAFPSGHSTVAHLTALFLLEVPGVAQRFGIFASGTNTNGGRKPTIPADFTDSAAPRYGQDQKSPLLWLAWRIAKGRERIGLHYSSDSAAGRMLAALIWHACLGAGSDIKVPALDGVIARAQAEWEDLPNP